MLQCCNVVEDEMGVESTDQVLRIKFLQLPLVELLELPHHRIQLLLLLAVLQRLTQAGHCLNTHTRTTHFSSITTRFSSFSGTAPL